MSKVLMFDLCLFIFLLQFIYLYNKEIEFLRLPEKIICLPNIFPIPLFNMSNYAIGLSYLYDFGIGTPQLQNFI